MALRLPDTACTPDGYRPKIPANTPHPLTRVTPLALHSFFYNENPDRWLAEVFAAQNGGDTSKFVEGVRIMSKWRHFPLKTAMHLMSQYLESDRGKQQLGLLRTFSSFEVVSDHLAVNTIMVSTGLLKDNLQLAADVSAGNGKAGRFFRVEDDVEGRSMKSNAPKQRHRTSVEVAANSGESGGVLQELIDAVVQETNADDIQPLKRRAKDDAGKSKRGKARRTNKDVQKEKFIESLQQRRTERYNCLDSSRFWRLRSTGRAVEKVLFEASLKGGAPISIRSYTIELSCQTTKALFSEDEWKEIMEQSSFDMPQLSSSIVRYLNRLRQCMLRGRHPHSVSPSQESTMSVADQFDCHLALKTAAEWYLLYTKKPSPFVVEDLSEAWWARVAWPVWLDLLSDVYGIFMVDGEKSGIDSSRRKNMDRQHNAEVPTRKKTGRKLDLVCRDEIQKHDWMIVERMRSWDTTSTKFLKEVEHVVVRETVTIAHSRMTEVPSAFRNTCRFFGGYTGGRGYTTIQLRPANSMSYVFLMQRSPLYVLPAEMGDLRSQFQGLVRILQIRAAMRATIEKYRNLKVAEVDDDDEDDSDGEADVSWMYEEPQAEFNCNMVVASSPSGPAFSSYGSNVEDDVDGGDA